MIYSHCDSITFENVDKVYIDVYDKCSWVRLYYGVIL